LGCIENATQPSPAVKSSKTTLHYVIQQDGARDLVLPPLPSTSSAVATHFNFSVI